MKLNLFLGVVLAAELLVSSSIIGADKMTAVTINGKEIQGVSRVTLQPEGEIIIMYGTSGTTVSFDKLPAPFAASWGITREAVEAARSAHKKKTTQSKNQELERAIRAGVFREVNGAVYDLRKPQPTWTTFTEARIFQKLEAGALVDPSPDRYSLEVIYVENIPRYGMLSDTERFAFRAKQVGTYDYINKAGNSRSVKSYDAGSPCQREDIPDAIIVDGKSFAVRDHDGLLSKDVLAALPQADELIASGSGFFVTEDGYFITNDHVIRGATKIKLRQQGKTFEAAVVKRNRTNDLALLKSEGRFSAIPIAVSKEADLGEAAFTIGFPNITLQGIEPKYTDGKISSLSGMLDDPMRFQISVPVQPGNSGGPLVNSDGNVIGVIVSRIRDSSALRASGAIPQNVNYAIKGKALTEFLRSVPTIKIPGKTPSTGKPDLAIKSVKDAVAMVLVY
jgi:S1-C subfamily serine protease